MNKSFIITEEERSRILGLHKTATSRQYLKENEEEWIDQSEDIEGESDFSKAELEQLNNIDEFNQLVQFFKENPDAAQDIKNSIENSEEMSSEISEKYKYYDYSDDSKGKQEIELSEYLKRKLMTYGVFVPFAAVVGYMMGSMAGQDILEAALLMAGMGGTLGAELSSNVGRERVKDDEEEI
jgi:hypothetical protein